MTSASIFTARLDTDVEAGPDAGPGPDAEVEVASRADVEAESRAGADADAESRADADADADVESPADARSEPAEPAAASASSATSGLAPTGSVAPARVTPRLSPEWSLPVVVPVPGARVTAAVPVHVVVATPRSAAADASLASTMDPVLWASTDAAPTSTDDTGHVVFHLGTALYAVVVTDVREVIRGVALALVPDSAHHVLGRPVALVDAHGRTVPVVDLRTDPSVAGDVLLPFWRRHLGIAVDRVESVLRPGELVAEPGDAVGALPSYARGVMRPVDGGPAVILVALPDATA